MIPVRPMARGGRGRGEQHRPWAVVVGACALLAAVVVAAAAAANLAFAAVGPAPRRRKAASCQSRRPAAALGGLGASGLRLPSSWIPLAAAGGEGDVAVPSGDAQSMPSDGDFAALQQRLNEERERPRFPLLVLDAMVPGQRMEFDSGDELLERLEEFGEVGVVGMWQQQALRHGVVAQLKRLGDMKWELKALKHVRLAPPVEKTSEGLTMARFKAVRDEVAEVDVEVARTLAPLVQEWCSLVCSNKFERFDGQVSAILEELGPMPSAEDVGALALWVAALVNPLPALGVAYEIRPAALASASVSKRLEVVHQGIKGSIGHVSGKEPLF
mmetsp:Transcript_95566/g.242897  ORF Transcript_95566/g.242897 Transcript_95566/m.242897 type:complete len:329 (-) Transcript_95566:118-1104(-)